jgi:hypothetical protein
MTPPLRIRQQSVSHALLGKFGPEEMARSKVLAGLKVVEEVV